jgi:hypothetical protein
MTTYFLKSDLMLSGKEKKRKGKAAPLASGVRRDSAVYKFHRLPPVAIQRRLLRGEPSDTP